MEFADALRKFETALGYRSDISFVEKYHLLTLAIWCFTTEDLDKLAKDFGINVIKE